MKIPGCDTPIIPEENIRDYLLSPVHPIGKFKAKFFCNVGYSQNDWSQLISDIEKILLNGNLEKQENTDYGTKWIVSGRIKSPSGKLAHIITVWMVKTGENVPRFITAYPGGRK